VGADGIAVRRQAGVWSIVSAPTTHSLTGVWGASAADVWAVTAFGYVAGSFEATGTILHWDGAAWSISLDRMGAGFAGVSGRSANDVSVVGNGHEPDGDYASLIEHWDGTAWTESYACNPEGTRFAAGGFVTFLTDVWSAAGGSVWAVGRCHAGFEAWGFVARGAGEAWGPYGGLALPLLEFRPLDAVWASADTNVWAASAGAGPLNEVAGTILHFDGTTWTESSDPNTMGIDDLGGSDANDVWAVGLAGKRLHFDGTAWR
jgi:hypothetical protein